MKARALTDAEWNTYKEAERADRSLHITTSEDQIVTTLHRRHAIAAIAMFGQDYGLTRADATLLADLLKAFQQHDSEAVMSVLAENFYPLVNLWAKVDSLTPPEGIATK